MKQDFVIQARVPEDDEDSLIIVGEVASFAAAIKEAAAILTEDLTPEEREHLCSAYCTDDGIYVIGYVTAPAGCMAINAGQVPTWGLAFRLARSLGDCLWSLIFRRK